MGEKNTGIEVQRDIKLFVYFFIGLVVTTIFTYAYRPYIYDNNINDFGIAGSAPSFLGLITAFFFLSYFDSSLSLNKRIFYTGLGGVVYEVLQPYFRTGLFDWHDIIAILLATLVLYLCSTISSISKRKQ